MPYYRLVRLEKHAYIVDAVSLAEAQHVIGDPDAHEIVEHAWHKTEWIECRELAPSDSPLVGEY